MMIIYAIKSGNFQIKLLVNIIVSLLKIFDNVSCVNNFNVDYVHKDEKFD